MLLNKPLWPVGSLIKVFIPPDRPCNTKAVVLSPSLGPLSHIYQNVRGLNSKIRSTFLNSVSTEFFCLAFTETWLKPDLHSSELFHNSFQVFRNDRGNRIGGGVLIAISASVPSNSIEFPTSPAVEFIAIRAKMPNKQLFTTYFYIPPNSDIYIYKKHAALICEVAKRSIPTDLVVALGDFNLPQVTWCNTDNSGCLVPTSTSDRAVVFFSELFDHNLGQYNRTPNCNGRLLDLCFANFRELYVNRCPPFSLPEDPYNPSM
ncbi:uncharacterized protein ACN427_000867 [Glossina fuscipes fuscipes]